MMNDNFNTDPNVIPFQAPKKKATYPTPPQVELVPLQELLNVMNSNIADLQTICVMQQKQLDYLKKENEWMLRFVAIVGGLFIGEILSKWFN